jgi:hypothetical protein
MPKPEFDMTEPDIRAWCAAYIRKALKLPDIPIDVHGEFPSLRTGLSRVGVPRVRHR